VEVDGPRMSYSILSPHRPHDMQLKCSAWAKFRRSSNTGPAPLSGRAARASLNRAPSPYFLQSFSPSTCGTIRIIMCAIAHGSSHAIFPHPRAVIARFFPRRKAGVMNGVNPAITKYLIKISCILATASRFPHVLWQPGGESGFRNFQSLYRTRISLPHKGAGQ